MSYHYMIYVCYMIYYMISKVILYHCKTKNCLFVFLQPTIIHLWLNPTGPRAFLRCMILCGFTSFMFGWHVHEKAILLVIIPMILLATDSREYARHFILISITGHVSLFPLIFTKFGKFYAVGVADCSKNHGNLHCYQHFLIF